MKLKEHGNKVYRAQSVPKRARKLAKKEKVRILSEREMFIQRK